VPDPRITPGGRAELGRVNFAIARFLGAATGGAPPNIFTTLGRHRRLFRKWLRFASALMPGGLLPRDESELLILRTAHNCSSDYEWQQHARIARTAGLSAEDVERVRQDPAQAAWSPRRGAMLTATDELHADRTISDATWSRLTEFLSDLELIEMCMLVGHYEMLAMTLNALRVQPDHAPSRRTRLMRVADAVTARGRRAKGRTT
jgi:alkylhydroperoxidase family enzyme